MEIYNRIKKYIKKNWIIILSIIFILIGGYFYFSRTSSYVTENNKKIQLYQDSVNILKSKIEIKRDSIKILSNKISSIDEKTSLVKTKIVYLKKEIEKKVDSVKGYTKNNIDSFLYKRYNDTIIVSQKTGKLIITDLITGDGAKNKLSLTEEQLKNTEDKIGIQSNIISQYKEEIILYDSIFVTRDKKDKIYESSINILNKDLKKEKRKLFLNKISSLAVMGTLTYFLITK